MHPMIQVRRIATSPADPSVFEVVIKYPAGDWRFSDRQWASQDEALAAIPLLQATGRLPTDAELTSA